MEFREAAEYAAEALALLSVCAVWWPAFKIPYILRFVSKMHAQKAAQAAAIAQPAPSVEPIRTVEPPLGSSEDVFSRVYDELAADERKKLDAWSPLDFALLLTGLVFAFVSSAIKLFYLLPTATH